MIRSMLFLPGNTPNMLINGDALGADAVILDLEDAVSPQEKDAARILVRNALSRMGFGCRTVVRINALDSGLCQADLEEITFYRNNAVLVTLGGEKYHRWGCPHVSGRSYLIYNVGFAELKGYTPCLDCWK